MFLLSGHLPQKINRLPSLVLAVILGLIGLHAQQPQPSTSFSHVVIYKQEGQYAAFPSLMKDDQDRLWVGFGWNTTGSHYGGAAGGQTGTETLYSPDGGLTWYLKEHDEGFQNVPVTARPYFLVKDSLIVDIAVQMHEVFPGDKKEELLKKGVLVKEWPQGHISASYRVLKYWKGLNDPQWQADYLELPPVASIGSFGQGCILVDGIILKPVYGRRSLAEQVSSAWVLRSTDDGETWTIETIAQDSTHSFTEPEVLELPSGRALAMIRAAEGTQAVPADELGYLWSAYSDDGGKTWQGLRRTNIWGYPPHLLLTRDGQLLCTYGYRRAPYGIRASFSADGGLTWDVGNEIVIRDDALPLGPGATKGGAGDLGYPKTVELADGWFFTAYYITLGDGVTHIAGTRWQRP